ncbi:hypothetical protein FRC0263_02124 [Corynebacterium diphtheriae]|nr:hypothetical protein FRC0263_02124 [Corynebacterium diphtheriae]
MFKRSLAPLAALAVVSSAVVAPANAMNLTVNDDNTCTINSTIEEAGFLSLAPTVTFPKSQIPILKTHTKGLPAVRMEKEELEKELDSLGLDPAAKAKLTSRLEEIKKRITAIENFDKALDACNAGENYDSEKPEGPGKQPEGSEKPEGPGKQPEGPGKQPEGSEKPEGPGKQPEGSEKPEGERALPSTNGAVIGVIVAVLGILAAALPVIKSILRALLP